MEFDVTLVNFSDIFTAAMVLFGVIDILGSVPIIIDLRAKVGHIQSEKASVVATFIMILFLFLGETILKFLGVDVNSFAIAGAFVIFFLALEMVLGIRLFKEEAVQTASIVPLAFPLIAGAGTMTTLISLKSEYSNVNIVFAIMLNMIFVYFVLKFSSKIEKLIGESGINVVRKVFGIVLLAIAVKFFVSNLKELL